MTDFYSWSGDELYLNCRVQTNAARDEFAEVIPASEGQALDRIRVRISCPAVEGKANKQLVKFLAGEFGVARSRIRIVSGERNSRKRICIDSPARLPAGLPITAARH